MSVGFCYGTVNVRDKYGCIRNCYIPALRSFAEQIRHMDSDSTIYVCTYGYEIMNRKGEKSTYADTLWIDTVLPVSKIEELIQESGVAEPASHIAQQVMPFIRFFGNEEKRIEFTQKWIGDAVKKLLQKDDIYESDMERIKYMRIGDCDFGGIYTIEMSTAAPQEPFCTIDGGDEWDPDGGAHVTGRFIRLYIDYAKRESCDIDSYTGECFFQLPPYDIWKEFAEEYEEAIQEEEDEEDEDAEDWESPVKKWESFEKTILSEEEPHARFCKGIVR